MAAPGSPGAPRAPAPKWAALAASLALGAGLGLLLLLLPRGLSLPLPPWLARLLPAPKGARGQGKPGEGPDPDSGPGEPADGGAKEGEGASGTRDGAAPGVRRPVRVYMDGCFDLMHLGHANGLRQAKALGDVLVVGVVGEEEMRRNKGPPVLTTEERLAVVRSVRWVDEVIPGIPYDVSPAFLQRLVSQHGIDLVVHGDDPCLTPDGQDAYATAKQQGRYREIKRTEGVSSTDILARILNCARSDLSLSLMAEQQQGQGQGQELPSPSRPGQLQGTSQFLTTARRIAQFAGPVAAPRLRQRVVYLDGAFDLFHAGHAAALEDARAQGDCLIVGVHADDVVRAHRGPHHPIMRLNERCMTVLACRHVSDVIFGAPWTVTRDLITTINAALVVHGTVAEPNPLAEDEAARLAVPRQMGILRALPSRVDMTTSSLMRRVLAQQEVFEGRHAARSTKEQSYYGTKGYVPEH